MGILVTKDGTKITKTVETVIATCDIVSVEPGNPNEGHKYMLDYGDAGSEIFYDTMEQTRRDGQLVYQTDDGNEYLETDLTLVEADDSGEPIIWTNHYECLCGTKWNDDWSCQCDDDCPSCGTTCSPSDSTSLIGGE